MHLQMRKKPTMLKCGRVSEFLVRNTFLFIGRICCKISCTLQNLFPEQHVRLGIIKSFCQHWNISYWGTKYKLVCDRRRGSREWKTLLGVWGSWVLQPSSVLDVYHFPKIFFFSVTSRLVKLLLVFSIKGGKLNGKTTKYFMFLCIHRSAEGAESFHAPGKQN